MNHSMTIAAKTENLDKIIDFVNEHLESVDCSMKVMTQMDIVVEELFVNIANYAYGDGAGDMTLLVEFTDEPRSVKLTFTDSGMPYDPLAREDPDVSLSAEERPIGGLGIFMVKNMVDKLYYEYKDGENILRLEKSL